MIRHIVALRFARGTTAETKQGLYAELAALQQIVPGTLDFRTFANISPETAVVHGFADLFWFDFTNEAARDAYLIHPAHQAAGARLVSLMHGGIEGVLVMDMAL